MSFRRIAIEIQGTVQGVGFRPFVYRLATGLDLAGWVINDARGVFIEAEGSAESIDRFVEGLASDLPAVAHIDSLVVVDRVPNGQRGFEIRRSDHDGEKTAVILPDLATCVDCLAEVFDPADRRFRYPFTNCTNCGPRFTIIRDLPYDRPNTSMAGFTMCRTCQAEYDDPANRRFHAQPNACPACGPSVAYLDPRDPNVGSGALAAEVDPIERAAALVSEGGILALKGLGGFQLVTDATNTDAVQRLRARKHRPSKPFAVMAATVEDAKRLVRVDAAAASLLSGPQAPIVLLRRAGDCRISESVAPGNPDLGVMLPTTPLHHLLARAIGVPVVATSGNLSDEPICIDNDEAIDRLDGIADGFLVHDRPIVRHVDDSVAWLIEDEPRILRRARGYAPLPSPVPAGDRAVLATGAHLKNTVSITVGDRGFTSQHIGDLSTVEAHEAFRRVIDDLLRMYDVEIDTIAHDLHPDYLSTSHAATLALDAGASLEAVQHHHAHLASCLVDTGFDGEALGVCWDGTGLGNDRTIWGGEFLLGTTSAAERVGHLRPFRLPGGDTAVREPRRSAAGLLHALDLASPAALGMLGFDRSEALVVRSMLARSFNSPVTTSAGRLFDGVSALLGLASVSTFEGEGAMALEHRALDLTVAPFPFAIDDGVADWEGIVEACASWSGDPSEAASRFHVTLTAMIVEMALTAGVEHVALTGGCFQNRTLTEFTAHSLRDAGFTPLLHRQIPPNDGGISIGQVAVARARAASKQATPHP